jgi:hypothetical protein
MQAGGLWRDVFGSRQMSLLMGASAQSCAPPTTEANDGSFCTASLRTGDLGRSCLGHDQQRGEGRRPRLVSGAPTQSSISGRSRPACTRPPNKDRIVHGPRRKRIFGGHLVENVVAFPIKACKTLLEPR